MTVKILLFIIAYNAVFSDEQLPESVCEESDEIKLNNKCQNSCSQGSTPLSDVCKGDDCYSIACICGMLLCLTDRSKAECKKDCKACLTDVCNPLTLTEKPTTVGTPKTKDVAIGVVVGVGAVALILIAAFLIFRHIRRRKRASAQGVTNTATGYQYLTTVASTVPPVAPYDNLKPAPPGEQNTEPVQRTGSSFNNHFSGETGYDNAGGQIHCYEEIRVDDYSEITHPDAGSDGRFVAPPGESGETTLLDNKFYGDNASNVRPKNASGGETTVVDNVFYQ